MGNDSLKKTFLVTILLSLVCSILVSGAAVILKPKQEQNVVLDVQRNILGISGLTKDAKSLNADQVHDLFKQVKPRLVDLKTGQFIDKTPNGITVDNYDQRMAAKDPKASQTLPGAKDIAGIKRQANVAKVYLVEKNGKMDRIVLPVHGYGLWSTMYGFLALDASDMNTVVGFGFYEQGETPGLGGEVDNPIWKNKWPGKQIYSTNGDVAMSVVKGGVDPSSPQAVNQIDGLAGATLTSNGVSNLIKFWMGKNGFEPLLSNLKSNLKAGGA